MKEFVNLELESQEAVLDLSFAYDINMGAHAINNHHSQVLILSTK